MKQALLSLARSLGLFALSRRLTRDRQRILCYHGIWVGPPPHYGDCLFMSPARFAARMQWLADRGWRVIPLDEAVRRIADGSATARDIAITIDDAWHGIAAHMLPVLKRHGFAATLYVTTYYALAQKPVLNVLIGYMVERARVPSAEPAAALVARIDALPTLAERWAAVEQLAGGLGVDLQALQASGTFMLMDADALRRAHADGVDLQLHTHTHRLHDFSDAAVRREIDINRERLSAVLGVPPASLRHFCFPSGEYEPRVFATLRGAGVVSATTTEFGLNAAREEPMALKRILDCESMTDLDIEARLSGFWSVLRVLRGRPA